MYWSCQAVDAELWISPDTADVFRYLLLGTMAPIQKTISADILTRITSVAHMAPEEFISIDH